jgi:TetR/AcrR family transcriptional regulator, transcriptional repressor for nem operon
MAGIKQFDIEEVLDRALEVFWQRGYEATSIQDLTEATGLGRGSLYSTFKDKEQMFLTVLEHYTNKVMKPLMTALNDNDPRYGIEGMFEAIIDRMSNPNYPRGCLITNTSLECPGAGDKINRKIAERIGDMESAIYRVLLQAQTEGSLAAEQDIRALAHFFVSTAQGMAVMHKTFADPSVIRDISRVALSVWEVVNSQAKSQK